MMKHFIDSATSPLTISANRMSISLLQCALIAFKDAVFKSYKVDFYFKCRTCLQLVIIAETINLGFINKSITAGNQIQTASECISEYIKFPLREHALSQPP